MNNLITKEIQLTSLELAEITGKRHADVMRDIRNEIITLGEEIGQRIFAQSSYTNSQNKEQPCYQFGRKGAMQLALKYDAKTRYKVIEKLEELEKGQALKLDSKFMYQLAQNLEKKEKQIEEMKPKALFADAVSTSKTTILIGELAKLIKQNGVDIGQNRLFKWLRSNEYLISRKGTDYNMPTQKSMELKLFEVKETSVTHADGHVSVNKTPKVTGKGQQYFINKFLKAKVS
jgi:Rha family phage regulatory protein